MIALCAQRINCNLGRNIICTVKYIQNDKAFSSRTLLCLDVIGENFHQLFYFIAFDHAEDEVILLIKLLQYLH